MKKVMAICTAAFLALTMCACAPQNDAAADGSGTTAGAGGAATTTTTTTTTTAADAGGNSDGAQSGAVKIGVIKQEYQTDDIVEILTVNSEGENAEVAKLNDAVKNGVQKVYEDFVASRQEPSWIEIRSYPFVSDDYVQIVTNYNVYPTYGTHGDIVSYNYSIKDNKYVTVEDALSGAGLTKESVIEIVSGLLTADYPTMTVSEVEVGGFLVSDGSTEFFLEITVENPDAEPWKGIFTYDPETEDFYELDNPYCLFDPSEMYEMDPPLAYATANLPYGEETISDGIYYVDLVGEYDDSGAGKSPREGADLVVSDFLPGTNILDSVDLSQQCIYISFQDWTATGEDGTEYYIYYIATGTVEGGFMGDNYEVLDSVAFDYVAGTLVPLEE